MDRRIEAWRQDSGAALPLPNPHFDPAQYEPDKIGVPAVNMAPRKKPAGKKQLSAPGREKRLIITYWS